GPPAPAQDASRENARLAGGRARDKGARAARSRRRARRTARATLSRGGHHLSSVAASGPPPGRRKILPSVANESKSHTGVSPTLSLRVGDTSFWGPPWAEFRPLAGSGSVR